MNMKKNIALAMAGVMAASVLFAGCGKRIDQNAVAATLKSGDDTTEVSLGLANFIAQYQAVNYDSYFLGYYGENMWSSDLSGTGSTMTDDVKADVMENIFSNMVLELHMSDYDITITDAEMDAINKTARQFIEDNTKKALKALGATEEYVAELLRQNLIESKMSDAIEAEVDTKVTDEEAAQRTFSYVKVSTDGYYDDDYNYVEYTEDETAQTEADVKAMAEAAKEDFDAAAAEYDYEVETYSYGADEESMDEAVITAADALKEGEVSALITTEDNDCYVIRLDSEFDKEKTDEKKDEIIKQRKSDHYEEVLQGYKDAVEWTVNEKAWAAVNFDELYTIKSNDSTEEMEATE